MQTTATPSANVPAAKTLATVTASSAFATSAVTPAAPAVANPVIGALTLLNTAIANLLNPFLAPPPNTGEPFTPALWAVLAYVRRNYFNEAPTVSATFDPQVEQVLTGHLGVDPEGDALTYTVTQQPTNGTLTIDQATGNFTYTPTSTTYTKPVTDSFSVSVTDGKTNLLSQLGVPHSDAQSVGLTVLLGAHYVDPVYNHPVIDSEQDVTGAVSYHLVIGHFEGTDNKFTIALPSKDQFEGRFFQNVYPLQTEVADPETIAFGVDSGAYTVQTNGGGGYRVDAAAAKFAKEVAAAYYDDSARIYGYVYGGSGGSYQTVGAIESTTGVWDGAVPYIIGVPTSFLNFDVRAMARLVLSSKAAQISDALSPGGSGDPYAGLNEAESAVLRETTNLGIPLKAWQDPNYVLNTASPNADGLFIFASTTRALDPTYADDFWSKPGYLGTEQSALGDFYRAAKIDARGTITTVTKDGSGTPLSVTLDAVPASLGNVPLDLTVYSPDGATKIGALSGTVNAATRAITLTAGNSAAVLAALNAGGQVHIDNRWSVALTAYARYQVPDDPSFTVFDQYRAADGTPLYPQRAVKLSPMVASSVTGGATYSGKINGNVIVVANLLDTDAFPWDGDWYSNQVANAIGANYADNFRLWYNDNADHITTGFPDLSNTSGEGRTPALVDYGGILQRALLDLSDWVENGNAPAQSTVHTVVDGQVHVPADAAQRLGVQPVVKVTVGGADHITVAAGQSVAFQGEIDVPPNAGTLTNLEWDPTGTGAFVPLPLGSVSGSSVVVSSNYTYATPGTYYAAIRATTHETDDPTSQFAGVLSLGRVRFTVA